MKITAARKRAASTVDARRSGAGSRRELGSRSAKTRIEEAIEDVDEQVDADEHRRGEQRHRLDQGVVTVLDRAYREPSDPRHGEDRLDHEGAAQQVADARSEDRED